MIRTPLLALFLGLLSLAPSQAQAPADKKSKVEKPAAPATKPAAAIPAAKPAKPAPAAPAAAPAIDPADQALLNHANLELKKLTPAQTTSLLQVLNQGTPAELQAIPGIGEVRAAAVQKARPFASSDQLIMVDGVGEATFDGTVKWVQDGMAKPTPKPTVKPTTKPTPFTPEIKPTPVKPAAKPTAKPETEAPKPEVLKPATKPAAAKPAAKPETEAPKPEVLKPATKPAAAKPAAKPETEAPKPEVLKPATKPEAAKPVAKPAAKDKTAPEAKADKPGA